MRNKIAKHIKYILLISLLKPVSPPISINSTPHYLPVLRSTTGSYPLVHSSSSEGNSTVGHHVPKCQNPQLADHVEKLHINTLAILVQRITK